jgi:glycerol-3-phosphate acyltransferase PlsX
MSRSRPARAPREPDPDLLKEAFKFSPLSASPRFWRYTSLRRLKKRIDPRRVNGGVFLGLNGTVVKSHGAADATGVSSAIKLAFQLAQSGFNRKTGRPGCIRRDA